ncbi:F-box-like protein [Ceratobasidium sp. AG-Ba]|nr:F-box-like protein [Ceratobasidium sp. AG-Ba]
MLTLSILPEEIIVRILKISTPDSIRQCAQVCHLFRDIVTESSCLQYLLELDICGYTEPPRGRSELTYPQKLDILRTHRARWNYPSKVVPVEYELNSDEHGVTYEYAGGTYVRGVPLAESDKLTRRLYFYQLPSLNRGTEYKYWCIPDLGVDTRDFGICPEQDLLVLLEVNSMRCNLLTEGVCRIHLRTMTTNQAHPRAKPGRTILTYHHPRDEPPPDRSFYFEISGDLLAILFRSRTRGLPSYVVIWDWTTGIELTRARTVGGWNASFTLLSECAFVLPRFSRSFDTEEHVPNDTFGSLNVFRFDPYATASTEPQHIASFDLPPLVRKNGESTVQIRCSPTVVPPGSRAYLNSSPKIYDLEPLDRLLCIDIHRMPNQGAGFAESAGTLFVPSSVLLGSLSGRGRTLDQNDCLTVPWATWAPKVSWADTRSFRTGNECYMSGQRSVAFQSAPIDQSSSIIILDFDSRRLKARKMPNADPQGVVCAPGDGSLDRVKEFTGKAAFCSEKAPASKKYVKMVLDTNLELDVDFWDTVMVDDEHSEIRQEGKFSLLVYNF